MERKIFEEGLKLESAQTKVAEKEKLLIECLSRESNLVKTLKDLKKELTLAKLSNMLIRILELGQPVNNRSRLGYNQKTSKASPTPISARNRINTRIRRTSILKCHYCGARCHLRPECYSFYKDQRKEKFTNKSTTKVWKQIWVRKEELISLISSTSKIEDKVVN